jgi:hypothetical protein
VHGRVLEEDTNKPMEGVIVVSRWRGRMWMVVDSGNACIHVENAITDSEGRYGIKGWLKPTMINFVSDIGKDLTAYKPGYYEPSSSSGKLGFLSKVTKYIEWKFYPKLYLAPFKGTREERVSYLKAIVTGNGCDEAGKSARNLYPLYKALYYDAKAQGATESDLKWFREEAAMMAVAAELNSKMSQTEFDNRIQHFLKDNLK